MKAFELSKKNQPLWESFAEKRLAEILDKQANSKKRRGETDMKAARLCLGQYKEAAILLDSLCPDFSKLTKAIVTKAKGIKPQKSNHINGFLLEVVGNKWLTVSRDVIIELIPVEYQTVVNLL